MRGDHAQPRHPCGSRGVDRVAEPPWTSMALRAGRGGAGRTELSREPRWPCARDGVTPGARSSGPSAARERSQVSSGSFHPARPRGDTRAGGLGALGSAQASSPWALTAGSVALAGDLHGPRTGPPRWAPQHRSVSASVSEAGRTGLVVPKSRAGRLPARPFPPTRSFRPCRRGQRLRTLLWPLGLRKRSCVLTFLERGGGEGTRDHRAAAAFTGFSEKLRLEAC